MIVMTIHAWPASYDSRSRRRQPAPPPARVVRAMRRCSCARAASCTQSVAVSMRATASGRARTDGRKVLLASARAAGAAGGGAPRICGSRRSPRCVPVRRASPGRARRPRPSGWISRTRCATRWTGGACGRPWWSGGGGCGSGRGGEALVLTLLAGDGLSSRRAPAAPSPPARNTTARRNVRQHPRKARDPRRLPRPRRGHRPLAAAACVFRCANWRHADGGAGSRVVNIIKMDPDIYQVSRGAQHLVSVATVPSTRSCRRRRS